MNVTPIQNLQPNQLCQARSKSIGIPTCLAVLFGTVVSGGAGAIVFGLPTLAVSTITRLIKEENSGEKAYQQGFLDYQNSHFSSSFSHFRNASLLLTGAKAAECVRHLGVFFENGHGVPRDFSIAAQHYQSALERNFGLAKTDLDNLYKRSLLTSGDALTIGNMYYNGQHNGAVIKKDYAKAKEWFDKAISLGNGNQDAAIATHNIGLIYEYGVGGSLVLAAYYYQKSLDMGYAGAQVNLDHVLNCAALTSGDAVNIGAMLYNGLYNGTPITKNFDMSRKFYIRAIEIGKNENNIANIAIAHNNIGLLDEHGDVARRDLASAGYYYKEAQEMGFTIGQNNNMNNLDLLYRNPALTSEDAAMIGRLYFPNKCGQDNIIGKMWYDKAKTLLRGIAEGQQLTLLGTFISLQQLADTFPPDGEVVDYDKQCDNDYLL